MVGALVRRHVMIVILAWMLALVACASPESAAPAQRADLGFVAATVDGAEFDGASLAGRPAVLWFWAPWCPTCVAEAPDVLDVAREHSGEVTVLGVASLGEVEPMREFIALTQTGELTHLADPQGSVWRRIDVAAQSTYVLLDAEGSITFTGFLTGEQLAARVDRLVG